MNKEECHCPYHYSCAAITMASCEEIDGIPIDCYKDFMSCPIYAIYDKEEIEDEKIIKKLTLE